MVSFPATSLFNSANIENVFLVCYHTIRSTSYSPPPAALITKRICNLELTEQPKAVLRDVGQILTAHPVPWIDQAWLHDYIPPFPNQLFERTYVLSDRIREELLNLDSGALFGAFVLFATWLEMQAPSANSVYVNLIKTSNFPMLNFIRWILIARFEPVESDEVQAEIHECKFAPEQQEFIWKWIRQENSLVWSE